MSYKTLRPFILSALVLLVMSTIGILLFKEFQTPVRPPITGIESSPPVHSAPISPEAKAGYRVAPTAPKYLRISSLNIDAMVISVGTTDKNTIDAPKTAWEVGWYTGSVSPGTKGTVLIDGHVNDAFGTPGIFYNLQNLHEGEELSITRGDGAEFFYTVSRIVQKPLEQVDMKELLQPVFGDEGLNLITCGGTYDRETGAYSDRVLVFAKRSR